MSLEEAATALHLLEAVLKIGGVDKIQVGGVCIWLTPTTPSHGDPAKAPRQERRDAGFQRPGPPPPPPGDPAKSKSSRRRDAARKTRDAARAAAHHARKRKLEVLARLGGLLRKAARILRIARHRHLAGQAAASSPAPQRSLVPARRTGAWTYARERRGFLLAGPRSGGGDGGGGFRQQAQRR